MSKGRAGQHAGRTLHEKLADDFRRSDAEGSQAPICLSKQPASNGTGGESSVEEALVEMYLAVISVRRIEDITEALWGSRVSPSTITLERLNHAIRRRTRVVGNFPDGHSALMLSQLTYAIWRKKMGY